MQLTSGQRVLIAGVIADDGMKPDLMQAYVRKAAS